MLIYTLLIALSALQADRAADNDTSTNRSINASLSIAFDNIVGEEKLQLHTGTYTNSTGETYSISLLQYFISNISVLQADGSNYTVPPDSSYFLVKASDPTTRFAKVNVPEGDYTTLTFTLGVDSLRNTMDISQRKGVLNPSGGMESGMYWGWNSGYIFFKLEGNADAAPVDPTGQHKYRYHIGGFGGYSAPTINNIRQITIDLRARGVAQVRAGREANIHLLVDIARLFNGNTTVSIATHPTVMFSAYSVNVANNFPGLFKHDHTEN